MKRRDPSRYPTLTPAELRTTPVVDVLTTAGVLQCGESTIRAAIKRGEIPVIRAGRSLRIPTSYLLRVLRLDDEPAAASGSLHDVGAGAA